MSRFVVYLWQKTTINTFRFPAFRFLFSPITADLLLPAEISKVAFCVKLSCVWSGLALRVPGEHHRCTPQSNPSPAVELPTAGMDTRGWWWWSLKTVAEMVKIADVKKDVRVRCLWLQLLSYRQDRGVDGGRTGSWLRTDRGIYWTPNINNDYWGVS